MHTHRTRGLAATLSAVLVLLGACGAPRAATVPERPSTPVAGAATGTSASAASDAKSTSLPTTAASEPADVTATPSPARTPTPRTDQQAHQMTLVGALELELKTKGAYTDIASYKDLAFIGTSFFACSRGVPIIDISNPAKPSLLAEVPPHPGMSMEDLDAMRIGNRDVLALGLQLCDEGRQDSILALDLIDITESRNPQRLSVFEIPGVEHVHGVHEFDLVKTPDGRALALLAVPEFEVNTAQEDGRGGTGDLLIVDISDPEQPKQIAEWGVQDEAALGPAFANQAPEGEYPAVLLHSVRASADGTRAFLSYWDAGVIILDIRDPATPKYLGRTSFAAAEEGNAHSIATSADEQLLVEADEDFSPKHPSITSNAFTGHRAVIARIPLGKAPTEEVVHVGRGCPADTVQGQPAEDSYTREISGTIALLDPGGCSPEQKAARAQSAGATGVILYGGETFKEMQKILEQTVLVRLPSGETVFLRIPVFITSYDTAQDLIAAPEPAHINFTTHGDSWGGLRLFDISDPQNPDPISTFRTVNAENVDLPAPDRTFSNVWSAHNPEIRDKLLFASWYRDGVRAVDISDPKTPREVGFWTGKGAPSDAPPVDIWGIALHDDLILASDRNFGLYILKMQP